MLEASSPRCSMSAAAFALAACTFLPNDALAATARVRWLPSAADAVARYDVYVRNAGAPYAAPAWSGNPAPAADGALEALVPFAEADANYFAVVAVVADGESSLSRELALGTPLPCLVDSCTTKTSCDFGNLPDGTFCDADAADPCSAVCMDGACTTAGADAFASDVTLDGLRFTERAAGVVLALKGRFLTEAAVDPTGTGAVIELRDPAGVVLYTASIGAAAFTANSAGTRIRFRASRANADPAWNGLTRLSFKRTGSKWLVTAQAKTSALAEAANEPAITLVVRLGGTCVRRVGAECAQKPPVSTCR